MMRRGGIWGAAVLVLLGASILHARPGVVRTRDGQTFEGDVNEQSATEVVVTIRKIPTRIPRDRIASIQYSQDPTQAFNERMAKLDAKDVNGRIALAREMIAQRQYVLARTALESALQIDNNNREATDMLETIRSLMRLELRKPPAPAEAARPPAPAAEPRADAAPAENDAATQPAPKVLTPAQINAVKQGEMHPDEQDIRIRFERNVQRRFVEFNSRYQPAEFFALNPMQQALVIMNEGLPQMRNDITIVNDPLALLQFRRGLQPYLIQNCATAGCHSGEAPKFNLIVPAEGDAATYTNFVLSTRYAAATNQQSDNVFGLGDLKLVDRQRPAQSLLLQFSIPPQQAEFRHPQLPGYRAPLRGANDARYVQVMNWIEGLVPVDPEYGFEFGGPATKPATAPAPATQEAAPAPPSPPQVPPRAVPPRPAPPARPNPPARR